DNIRTYHPCSQWAIARRGVGGQVNNKDAEAWSGMDSPKEKRNTQHAAPSSSLPVYCAFRSPLCVSPTSRLIAHPRSPRPVSGAGKATNGNL
ncbi:hypothetical protein THAOC_31082, partial [Thalassiosira oceanica]